MVKQKRRELDKEAALYLMQRYCVYQDRCQSEVRYRLIEHKVYGDDLENIIADLILDDFLNEERFARSYARGKFRIKSWGKIKIINQLKFKGISAYCLKKAMTEIEDEEYFNTLKQLLIKKAELVKSKNIYEKRKKLKNFALQKGYEYFLINEILNLVAKIE
ncbi:MAG: regulatory protein RecX [Saprospiraceae bacterium]